MPSSNRKVTVCCWQCKGALGIAACKLLTMHRICSWDVLKSLACVTNTGCMCELRI